MRDARGAGNSLGHVAEAQAHLLGVCTCSAAPGRQAYLLFLPLTSQALAGGYPGEHTFISVSKVWRPSPA